MTHAGLPIRAEAGTDVANHLVKTLEAAFPLAHQGFSVGSKGTKSAGLVICVLPSGLRGGGGRDLIGIR